MDKINGNEDRIIWNGCLKGDLDYVEILYRRYYAFLVGYGVSICGNKEEAVDYCQTLFLNIITNYKKLSKTDYVKAYLLRSYRNLFIDNYRTKRVYTNLEDLELEDLEWNNELANKYDIEVLKESFNQLSYRQKEIVYLFYFKELSHAEIAVILDMNVQSSRNLLSMTMSEFRRLFNKMYY